MQKEELEQRHLHLLQVVESEMTAKWQYTQQCEELATEIKKLRAEVINHKHIISRSVNYDVSNENHYVLLTTVYLLIIITIYLNPYLFTNLWLFKKICVSKNTLIRFKHLCISCTEYLSNILLFKYDNFRFLFMGT